MGDRYFLEITCPKCGLVDIDCYFAPTCGFTTWKCKCGHIVNLIELTEISLKMASNKTEIEDAIKVTLKGISDNILHPEPLGEEFQKVLNDMPYEEESHEPTI